MTGSDFCGIIGKPKRENLQFGEMQRMFCNPSSPKWNDTLGNFFSRAEVPKMAILLRLWVGGSPSAAHENWHFGEFSTLKNADFSGIWKTAFALWGISKQWKTPILRRFWKIPQNENWHFGEFWSRYTLGKIEERKIFFVTLWGKLRNEKFFLWHFGEFWSRYALGKIEERKIFFVTLWGK